MENGGIVAAVGKNEVFIVQLVSILIIIIIYLIFSLQVNWLVYFRGCLNYVGSLLV